jgi:hypothetical protein
MKVYLKDQHNRFKYHLGFLKTCKVIPHDLNGLDEKATAIDIQTEKKLSELDLNFLFNYHVFPENIIAHKTQWDDEKRKMKPGDIITQ